MTVDKQEFVMLMEAVRDLKANVRELRSEVKCLQATVNQGRGALWVIMSLGAIVTGIAALFKFTKGG